MRRTDARLLWTSSVASWRRQAGRLLPVFGVLWICGAAVSSAQTSGRVYGLVPGRDEGTLGCLAAASGLAGPASFCSFNALLIGLVQTAAVMFIG